MLVAAAKLVGGLSASIPSFLGDNALVRVSAKVDYALRAAVELASAQDAHLTCESMARSQQIPHKFLEAILADMRTAGLVRSRRGTDGGFWLSRPANTITVADIIRAVDGPLASVRGERPQDVSYPGVTGSLPSLWVAARASLRSVFESVTLADLAAGRLPGAVKRLLDDADAWRNH